MDFFLLNWSDVDSGDEDSLEYEVSMWGVTSNGELVCVRNNVQPYFYVRLRDLDGVSEVELSEGCARMVRHFQGFARVQRVYGKPFTGYQADNECFLKLIFNSQKAMRYVNKALRVNGLNLAGGSVVGPISTFESHVPPIIRPMHEMGILATGWCRVQGSAADKTTMADFEFYNAAVSPVTDETFAPIVVATFDIEVYSSHSTADDPVFPCATNDNDVIVAIVTAYSTITDPEPFYIHTLTLSATDLDGVDCTVCESEKDLLNRWADEIVKRKAIIWLHFNGLGFDEEYMYTRAVRVGAQEMLHMGWIAERQEPVELKKSSMESAAYGHNSFAFMKIEGVFHLDLMVAIKKDFNLQSYSLNYCGEYFCAETKIDLSPQKQFDLYRSGKMKEVLEYCVQDVRLTLKIATKVSIITALVEMAGQTSVPIDFLITRGQQIKMLSR